MAINYDPFSAARTIGQSWYKDFGAKSFEDLQITHTLRCLNRTQFDDNPSSRLRRHTLTQAGTGIGKTSVMLRFMQDCAGAQDIMDSDPNDTSHPTYLDVGGSGVTWERMRGSVNDRGDIVLPLLRGVDYIMATEFMAFIGTNKSTAFERANELCRILEEGRVTVSLVKMASASDKKKAAIEAACSMQGIHYNPTFCGFSYDVDFFMLAATRPLGEEDNINYLTESGLMPRFSVSTFNPSEAKLREYRRNQFGVPDATQLAELRRFNLYSYTTPVENVMSPPKEQVDEIMDYYYTHYERICDDANLSIGDVATGRDYNDACQLLVAKASSRTFSDAYSVGEIIIDEIAYEDRWVRWVKNYRAPYLADLYDQCMMHGKDDPLTGKMRESLAEYIKTRAEEEDDEASPEIHSRDLIGLIMKDFKVKQREAYNKLNDMGGKGLIEKTGFNSYRVIDEQTLRLAGVREREDYNEY